MSFLVLSIDNSLFHVVRDDIWGWYYDIWGWKSIIFFFNWQTEKKTKKLFWTNKKFVYFFNWEKYILIIINFRPKILYYDFKVMSQNITPDDMEKTNIHQMISILVHRHTCQLLPLLLNQFSYKSKSPFKIAAFFQVVHSMKKKTQFPQFIILN